MAAHRALWLSSVPAQAQQSPAAARSNHTSDSPFLTLHQMTFIPQLAAQEAKEWELQNDWNDSVGDILRCISYILFRELDGLLGDFAEKP